MQYARNSTNCLGLNPINCRPLYASPTYWPIQLKAHTCLPTYSGYKPSWIKALTLTKIFIHQGCSPTGESLIYYILS